MQWRKQLSYHVTEYVLALEGLSPTEKAVLHCLAFYAHADGTETWPSMTRIAKESGLSDRRSAQRIVRRMEERGILIADTDKIGGRRNSTSYRFNLEYSDRGVAHIGTKGDRGVAGADLDVIGNSDPGATLSEKQRPGSHKRATGGSPERLLNQKKENHQPSSPRKETIKKGTATMAATAGTSEWKYPELPTYDR